MEKVKKIFYPPVWVLALVSLSFPLLAGIFFLGWEGSLWAVLVYVVSAYALTADGLWLAPMVSSWWRNQKPQGEKDLRKHLLQNLAVSLGYAAFNLALGAGRHSAWLASNGAYYGVLALIYLMLAWCQIRKKDGWSAYTVCGWCLLAVNLTMSGIVFQMIWRGEGEAYPGLLVYGAAAHTFYKLIGAILGLIRSRHNNAPIQGAARNMGHTEALMSLFSLQTALFAAFGRDFPYQHLMNTITGTAVCLLTVLGAAGMICHGTQRKRAQF